MNKPTIIDTLKAHDHKLLDLSCNNSLLDYRHPSSESIRIVNTQFNPIYQTLKAGNSFILKAIPEPTQNQLMQSGYISPAIGIGKEDISTYPTAEQWAQHLNINTQYSFPRSAVNIERPQPEQHYLQALQYGPELEARLRHIKLKSTTALQEHGVNTLYLTLGFLQWYEKNQPTPLRHAPLFTIPVQLIRSGIEHESDIYRYAIQQTGDDLISNTTLATRLKQEFNLTLPDMKEFLSPEIYLETVQHTIQEQQPQWQVFWQASITMLNFSRQTIFQDLSSQFKSADIPLEKRPLVRQLFISESPIQTSSPLPANSNEQSEKPGTRYPLIYPADQWQYNALVDAVNGKNLVIEGAPGSGKSQYITNLIASFLGQGKKILFLTDKLAAIDTVKNRLDKAGLGQFCLELQGYKSDKHSIIASLLQTPGTVESTDLSKRIAKTAKQQKIYKLRVDRYTQLLCKVWKKTGLTVYQILNKATCLHLRSQQSPADSRFAESAHQNEQTDTPTQGLLITNVSGDLMTPDRRNDITCAINDFSRIYQTVLAQCPNSQLSQHCWYGITNHRLDSSGRKLLMQELQQWTRSLKHLDLYWQQQIQSLQLNIESDVPLSHIRVFCDTLAELPELNGGEPLVLLPMIIDQYTECRYRLQEYEDIHRSIDQLSNYLEPAALTQKSTLLALNRVSLIPQKIQCSNTDSFSQTTSNLYDLSRLAELTLKINQKITALLPIIPPTLHSVFSPTWEGILESTKLLQCIQQLPLTLWPYRNKNFTKELAPVLVDIINLHQAVRERHGQLEQYINLADLPTATELQKHIDILNQSNYFLRFSTPWKQSQQVIRALFKTYPGKQNTHPLLLQLLEYKQKLEQLTCIIQQVPVLKMLYQGIDTPIENILDLHNWHKTIEQEYFSASADQHHAGDFLLTMSNDTALSLINACNQGLLTELQDACQIIKRLENHCASYLTDHIRQSSILGHNNPLQQLTDYLEYSTARISNVLKVQHLSFQKITELYNQLEQLQDKISAWQSRETPVLIESQITRLSVQPGGYDPQFVNTAKTLLKVAQICAQTSALTNSLYAEPSFRRYRELKISHPKLNALLTRASDYIQPFLTLGKIPQGQWYTPATTITTLIEHNQYAIEHSAALSDWIKLLHSNHKLQLFHIENALSQNHTRLHTCHLSNTIDRQMYHQLAQEIIHEVPVLNRYKNGKMDHYQTKLHQCEQMLLNLQRQALVNAVLARQTKETENNKAQMSVLIDRLIAADQTKSDQEQKTENILNNSPGDTAGADNNASDCSSFTIRCLLHHSASALQAAKPCFMMSSVSVAHYLEPETVSFDLIVIDEASQMRCEDAIGALARGSQLVVVGDSKQLLPSNRHHNTVTVDTANTPAHMATSIFESVEPLYEKHKLKWHYRAQHESLMKFSNANFYNNDLILYPSPYRQSEELGISFSRVARGRYLNKRNVEEAREAVRLISNQLLKSPNESVGVITMNAEQCTEIERQLNQQIKENNVLYQAMGENQKSIEPLFIKSLEDVQGEERDVIIISLTYGPRIIGQRVSQHFGLISSNLGWRYINVLISRSKKRMQVLSSIEASDILIGRHVYKGVKLLKDFLIYCESGSPHLENRNINNVTNDLVRSIVNVLEKEGYQCDTHLSVGSYNLDIAIRDNHQTNNFLLGIISDYAYFSSIDPTNNYEQLQQEVLEHLGWNIFRLWTLDWYRSPEIQLEQLREKLKQLQNKQHSSTDNYLPSHSKSVMDHNTKVTPTGVALSKGNISRADRKKLINDLQQTSNLEQQLMNYQSNIIAHELPETKEQYRLLRPAMRNAILNYRPCSKAEFIEKIPAYLWHGTAAEEKIFLEDILSLVADYG